MRHALLAVTALWPIAAFGQQIDQGTAQMIMSSQQQQVPGGECYTLANGPCNNGLVPITFQPGDVVLSGSITDAQGNVWSLQPDSCNGNPPASWWSGLYENGQQISCGYGVALRNVNGTVWYEEAKGSGWRPATQNNGLAGPYVTDPGQGSGGGGGGGQATSAPIAPGSTTSAPVVSSYSTDTAVTTTSPTTDPNAPCQEAGAVTPNNGTFTANGNTYSIDGNNGDVASVNGAPLNQWSYQTSQLVLGSDGQVYGQSNAADNNGTWFVLSADGSSWGEPLSGTPAAVTSGGSSIATQMATSAGPVVCPTTPAIQAQISSDNQEIQQLMAQIHAYQTAPTTTTPGTTNPSAIAPAPTDTTGGQ